MNLNTIRAVQRPASADEIGAVARRQCLARRRHVAVLRAAARPRHADRSGAARLAGAGELGRRASTIAATCRIAELYRVRGAAGVDAPSPLFRPVLQCVPGVVQDLERGDRRRQRLHVAAGRADDLADRGARRRLHAVAARRRAARRCRWSTSSPATTRTCCRPGELLRSIHLPAAALTQAHRLPPRVAHQARPLGGADHRHAAAPAAICC